VTAPVQATGPSLSGGGPAPSPDWDEVLADIGDRVRAERLARHWSQTELGRRAGLDWQTVKRLESGIGPLRCFVQACWGLGVPMDRLLSAEWQMPEPPPTLTRSQMRVLRAVGDGRPLSVAAVDLGMTPAGLASRLSEIYRRLGVAHLARGERRAAAVRVASAHGLFDAA